MHSVRVGGCGLPRVRSPGEITRPQETSPVKHQRYFPHMGRPSYIPSSEGMCQYSTYIGITVIMLHLSTGYIKHQSKIFNLVKFFNLHAKYNTSRSTELTENCFCHISKHIKALC